MDQERSRGSSLRYQSGGILKNTILIFLTVYVGVAAGGDDSNSTCTCYTQDVVAERGTPFSVGVFVNNTDTLAGMQIPVYYRSETVKLCCDSVTFQDTRCSGFVSKIQKIDPTWRIVYFVVIGNGGEILPPGDGLVANLWFTADKKAASGRVELFSGPNAYIPDEKINYSFLFWSPTARQVNCQYKPGFITVR